MRVLDQSFSDGFLQLVRIDRLIQSDMKVRNIFNCASKCQDVVIVKGIERTGVILIHLLSPHLQVKVVHFFISNTAAAFHHIYILSRCGFCRTVMDAYQCHSLCIQFFQHIWQCAGTSGGGKSGTVRSFQGRLAVRHHIKACHVVCVPLDIFGQNIQSIDLCCLCGGNGCDAVVETF